MATLSLMFTGLCAFVPNHNSAATRARLLMVDALRGHVPHYPVLVFPLVSWASGRRPDGDFHDGNGNRMGFCRLDDQDLWIEGAKDNRLSILGQGEFSECPRVTNMSSFGWVAPMAKINRPSGGPNSPVWGEVDGRYLDSSNIPNSVISRFNLTEGSLSSHMQAQDDLENIVKWRFQVDPFSAPVGHVQALSEEVVLDFSSGASETIGFAGIIGIHGLIPRPLETIYLKPTPDGVVHAWIENMPWEQITGREYDESIRARRMLFQGFLSRHVLELNRKGWRSPDYHFVHFYDLIKGPRTGRIPYPEEERCPNDGQPSGDNPKCPPVQLSADPRA